MAEIIKNDLTSNEIDEILSKELGVLYNGELPIASREVIKGKFAGSVEKLLQIVDYYFQSGGEEMSEEDFEGLSNSFESLKLDIITTLDRNKADNTVYTSIGAIWLVIFNMIERDGKQSDEFLGRLGSNCSSEITKKLNEMNEQ